MHRLEAHAIISLFLCRNSKNRQKRREHLPDKTAQDRVGCNWGFYLSGARDLLIVTDPRRERAVPLKWCRRRRAN